MEAGVSEEEKSRLLHCVVVGGGPTGVEFSGELSDFIMRDVRQRYSHVKDYIHVTLIEVCRTTILVSNIIKWLLLHSMYLLLYGSNRFNAIYSSFLAEIVCNCCYGIFRVILALKSPI